MFILGPNRWDYSAVRHLWATFHLLSVIFIFNTKHIYQNDAVDLYNDFHLTASKNIILIAKGLFMPILWNKGRLSLADETSWKMGSYRTTEECLAPLAPLARELAKS